MARRTTRNGKTRRPITAIFGDRLREWRKEQGFPLKHVAQDLGVSVSVVSQWERGLRFPSARNLDRLADYMRITVGELLTEK